MGSRLDLLNQKVEGLRRRLRSPVRELAWWHRRQEDLLHRLRQAMFSRLHQAQNRTAALASRLDSLSPLKILDRGYAIVLAEKSGDVVRNAQSLKKGDEVRIRFGLGQALATIEKVEG
jgi:exodeoxyribonuclease VII large subunit